ncbi:MAG: hypothetical protein ACLQGP_01305 [Isosphaeraceae bacterium]
MGITIAYRGRIADLARIEDFEDRLIDCALEIGAMAQIWRSWADDRPDRMVRGVILGIAPGQESTSLLLSLEGWLIGLTDIEDAEEGLLKEPPWCFVKTQFGSVESHVALVEILTSLKRVFLPDLEVSDEGGYWVTRDLAELVRKRDFTQRAIDSLAEGLRRHGITREAAEDPNILLRHVERVAAQVHRILHRPAEHPPIEFGDHDDLGGVADPEAMEKLWDELSKSNRRQQERIHRAIDERRSRGLDDATAIREALRDILPAPPDDETERSGEPWRDDEHPPFVESLTDWDADIVEADDGPFEAEEETSHPLLQKAIDLLEQISTTFPEDGPRSSPSLTLIYQGAAEVLGGLAQSLSDPEHDPESCGLRVVQLKRALRGAAFARGALLPLRSTIISEPFDELFRTLQRMETDLVSELGKVRSEYGGDDG